MIHPYKLVLYNNNNGGNGSFFMWHATSNEGDANGL